MKTKHDYYKLQSELEQIEKANNAYITDPVIDIENTTDAGINETDEKYWDAMYASMCSAAGSRCEELGLDVNKLLGRVIY
jgi:hypothetical protein